MADKKLSQKLQLGILITTLESQLIHNIRFGVKHDSQRSACVSSAIEICYALNEISTPRMCESSLISAVIDEIYPR